MPLFVHVLLWPELLTKLFEKVEDPKIGGSQRLLSKVVHTVMSNYSYLSNKRVGNNKRVG